LTGYWKLLRNEELNDLYCLTNIVRLIRPRRKGWVGHVARIGDRRGALRFDRKT